MGIVLYVLFLSVAIFLIAQRSSSIKLNSFGTAITVAVVFSIIDFLIGSVLKFIGLPFVVVTLGLFLLVINTFLLWLTDKLVSGFEIDGFGATVVTAFFISVCSYVLGLIF